VQIVDFFLEHDGHVALEFDPFRATMGFEHADNTDFEIVSIVGFGDSAMDPARRVAKSIGLAAITSDGSPDSFFNVAERALMGKASFELHYILHLGSIEHNCPMITIAVTRELNQ